MLYLGLCDSMMDEYNSRYVDFLDRFKDSRVESKFGRRTTPSSEPKLVFETDPKKGICVKTRTRIERNAAVCWYTGCVIPMEFVDDEIRRHKDRVMAHVHNITLPVSYTQGIFKQDEYALDARNFALLLKEDRSAADTHIWACGGMLNAPEYIMASSDKNDHTTKCRNGNVIMADIETAKKCDMYELYNATYKYRRQNTIDFMGEKLFDDLFGFAGILMIARRTIPAGTELTYKYDCTPNYSPDTVEVFKAEFT